MNAEERKKILTGKGSPAASAPPGTAGLGLLPLPRSSSGWLPRAPALAVLAAALALLAGTVSRSGYSPKKTISDPTAAFTAPPSANGHSTKADAS